MPIQAKRYHDISCGHRVVGHEGKCQNLHGHNYRITFTVESCRGWGGETLDSVGRVLDFGVIKAKLCVWLENEWDHRMLLWEKDPLLEPALSQSAGLITDIDPTIVLVPFNPTAENIGLHLLKVVGPELLHDTGAILIRVEVEETRKCSAVVEI